MTNIPTPPPVPKEYRKKKASRVAIAFACILGFLFLILLYNSIFMSEEDRIRADQERAEKAYNQFKQDSLEFITKAPRSAENYVEDRIKEVLKDPDSFKVYHINTGYDPDLASYIVDIDFGARNSFGGMSRSRREYIVMPSCKYDTTKQEIIKYFTILSEKSISEY